MINPQIDENLNEAVSEAMLEAGLDVLREAVGHLENTGSREEILNAVLETGLLEHSEECDEQTMAAFAKIYYVAINPSLDRYSAQTLCNLAVDVLAPAASRILARRLAQNPLLPQDTYLLLLVCLAGDTGVKRALASNPGVGRRVLTTLLQENAEIAGAVLANPACSLKLRESAGVGLKAQFESQLADDLGLISAATSPEEFSPLVPLLNFDQETLDTAFAANPNTPAGFREVLMERGGTASWIIINKMHENYYTH